MTAPAPRATSPGFLVPRRDTAATRHLCAAAYLDESFQRESLREAFYRANRVVAPSYGFRLIPVLWHCLRARNMTVTRDSAITALVLLTACLSAATVLSLFTYLVLLYLAVTLGQMAVETVRRVRSGGPVVGAPQSRGGGLLIGLLALLGVWVLWFVVTAASFAADPAATDVFAVSASSAVLLILVVTGLSVGGHLWRQQQLASFVPGNRATDPPRSARFDQIFDQQQGNTVIYSGYHPFVGSGEIIDTWGFAQRLVQPDPGVGGPAEGQREFRRSPFTAQEIIDYVADQLRPLITDPDPERQIPGLTVEHRVFLAGTEVSQLSPVTDPTTLAAIIRQPTAPARHYLACQVVSWQGELVTSVYIHFAVQGRSLYLEITTTALPPCHDRYRVVDQVDGIGAMANLRAFGRGIVDAPRTVAAAPLNLIRSVVDVIASSLRTAVASSTVVTQGFDYGARFSVRELGASAMTRNHVQTQDIIKHKRLIERRVVAATLDFLESRGVDTNEYRQRALTILNAGAVNTGSGSMLVGTATGQQNQPTPAPPPGTAA